VACATVINGKRLTYHGKKFKTAQKTEYETFLKALRREAETTSTSLLAFTLLDTSTWATLVPTLERVVEKSLTTVGAGDAQVVLILQRLFPGLATLQRLSVALKTTSPMDIVIDQDAITKKYGTTTIVVKGKAVQLPRIARTVYEGHRKHLFPKSPPLGAAGIAVMSDAKSVAVQGADVLGNFAMAFARVQLGDPSSKLALKAELFASAFGDLIDTGPLKAGAVLNGSDIQLLQPGALTLSIV
jgi:hypothetical protein